MTAFVRENFDYFGGYLTYEHNGKREFIARFKYRGMISKGVFVTQLIKRFSVERYLEIRDTEKGIDGTPIKILQNDDPVWYENRVQKFLAKNRR